MTKLYGMRLSILIIMFLKIVANQTPNFLKKAANSLIVMDLYQFSTVMYYT